MAKVKEKNPSTKKAKQKKNLMRIQSTQGFSPIYDISDGMTDGLLKFWKCHQ